MATLRLPLGPQLLVRDYGESVAGPSTATRDYGESVAGPSTTHDYGESQAAAGPSTPVKRNHTRGYPDVWKSVEYTAV